MDARKMTQNIFVQALLSYKERNVSKLLSCYAKSMPNILLLEITIILV
jgi:hypothetical protein